MMRKICLCLGLLLTGSMVIADEKKTDELTDPVEILKKADAASKAAKFVKYHATSKREGVMATRLVSAEGDVVLQGYKGGRAEKFRCDAKAERAGGAEGLHFTAGTDSETYFAIDHKNKKAYVDIDPQVVGSFGGPAQALTMLEYVHETPFSDEINGKKQELKGTRKVGDEDCYEIYVEYAQENQRALWSFSKKDFLPRAVKRMFKSPEGGEGSSELTVTNLTVQPKTDKDPFKFELPEGYAKTDDFAP